MIYVIVLSQFQLQSTASRWQHIFFLLKNTWWSQPLLHHQSSFHAYFFAHILSLRGRKQMFKACSCSAARDLKTVEMSETFSDGEINRHGKHVKQKPISSFRIILSVMVSNSVYMSSLLWYKQSYFVLATQRLLWVPMWSWKITEKKKKTWSAPTSCESSL